jgi:Domain of unknown function (DUF6457)
MNRDQWIEAYAELLGTAKLTEAEIDELLALAAAAAHASERTAAPLACYLAGRSGQSTEDALELARRPAGND